MQVVTEFHPNRFYLHEKSGTLIYLLAARDKNQIGLGVIVGPILAEVTESGWPSKKILSNIKLIYVYISQIKDHGQGWHEIGLPASMKNRIYIALQSIADLFTHLSKSMNVSVLTLNKSEKDLTQEQFNTIDEMIKNKGMWLASPEKEYFEYQASIIKN
ncbi:hypothetical protein LCGC14_1764520 [marine sediment metagenome]|uniref:Uncharacterized protein n=1 Tax=marine sediment metagenome TaxID=412755 RepID=A0A0F9JF20_9ZZZZ